MIYLLFGLHPDTWEWVELSGYGDLPPPRDFAAGASVGNGKLVMCVLSLSLSFSSPLQYTKAKGIEATHSCYWSAPNSMRLYGNVANMFFLFVLEVLGPVSILDTMFHSPFCCGWHITYPELH
jgi:hypothetical protein